MDVAQILEESSLLTTNSKISTFGKSLILMTGGIGIALTVVCAPFVSPALRRVCLPYVPATVTQVQNVMQALRAKKGQLIDIGSGDGRIVLEAAKNGFTSHGVELNRWLVYYSRLSAFSNNLFSKTKFFKKDLWKFSLQPYNNIVIFGVDEMMVELEKKILREVQKETTVVACRFPLPNLVPLEVIGHGVDTVWRYEITKC